MVVESGRMDDHPDGRRAAGTHSGDTLNPAYRLSELEFALAKVGCRALVIPPPFKSSDYPAMIQQLAPELASCVFR
jgi:hypothetical protein